MTLIRYTQSIQAHWLLHIATHYKYLFCSHNLRINGCYVIISINGSNRVEMHWRSSVHSVVMWRLGTFHASKD